MRRIEAGRKCSRCGSDKTYFHRKGRYYNWYSDKTTGKSICVRCYYQQYRIEHKERLLSYNKQWHITAIKQNPDYYRISYLLQREYNLEYKKVWRLVNPDYRKIYHLVTGK